MMRIAWQRDLIDDTASLWQSRYHDHIIRNDPDLNPIRQYVLTNLTRWMDDSLNTLRVDSCGALLELTSPRFTLEPVS